MSRSPHPKFRMKTQNFKKMALCPFNHFLLCLELLDDSEFERDDVLGEDDNMTFISVESSYMRKNVR